MYKTFSILTPVPDYTSEMLTYWDFSISSALRNHVCLHMYLHKRPCSDSRHVTAPYKLTFYYYYYIDVDVKVTVSAGWSYLTDVYVVHSVMYSRWLSWDATAAAAAAMRSTCWRSNRQPIGVAWVNYRRAAQCPRATSACPAVCWSCCCRFPPSHRPSCSRTAEVGHCGRQ